MTEKIKIRWKEGVGLFVFLILSGLYFFGTPDFSGVLDYKYDYYHEDIILFLFRVILPAPFLVGIFLLSLYKTEKRIKEGRFNFWRPLVFSLATALITGLVWTLQFITGSGYGYESFDVVKKLFFDAGMFPVIPMTLTLLFSFVPSLLLYKFYLKLKQKKFYIAVASFFVLLFLGLFGYQQVGVLTCEFNYDGYCVGSKAIKVKDISLCEKVKNSKEFGNYDNYGKNSCYEAISRRWYGIDLCDRIKTISNQKSGNTHYSQYQLHQCVSNIARNTKNKELCEKIPVSESKAFELIRERCFNDSENKLETDLNNWKTYKNEKHGIEFSYPANLTTEDNLKPYGCIFVKKSAGSNVGWTYLELCAFSPDTYDSSVDFVKWIKDNSEEYNQVPSAYNFKIGGIDAVKVYHPKSPQTFSSYKISFLKDKRLYEIFLNDIDSEENTILQNQIIPTFKFKESLSVW